MTRSRKSWLGVENHDKGVEKYDKKKKIISQDIKLWQGEESHESGKKIFSCSNFY